MYALQVECEIRQQGFITLMVGDEDPCVKLQKKVIEEEGVLIGQTRIIEITPNARFD